MEIPLTPTHTRLTQQWTNCTLKWTRRRRRKETSLTTVTDAPVDQLYAQVDKKKSKGEEVCEDSPQESGSVYSVVNKPRPPQVPAKSDLLMDDLYN